VALTHALNLAALRHAGHGNLQRVDRTRAVGQPSPSDESPPDFDELQLEIRRFA